MRNRLRYMVLILPLSIMLCCLADPATGEYSTIYSTDGSTISAGSTAIIFGKHLYICQVFDPYILKVELEP